MKLFFLLFSSSFFSISSYTTFCDAKGACKIITSYNFTYFPSQGKLIPYDNTTIQKKWNNTQVPLTISSQIDGVSLYSPLKGEKGYECFGGLSECINSCCLDGFCVDILFYCHQQKLTIEMIYIFTTSGFVFLAAIYWGTFFILGCNFNEKIKSEKKEHQMYDKITNNDNITNNFNFDNTEFKLNDDSLLNKENLLKLNQNKIEEETEDSYCGIKNGIRKKNGFKNKHNSFDDSNIIRYPIETIRENILLNESGIDENKDNKSEILPELILRKKST